MPYPTLRNSGVSPILGAAGTVDRGLAGGGHAFGQIAQADITAGAVPTLISKQTVTGSPTAAIQFNSIPSTYSHLMLNIVARSSLVGTVLNTLMQFGSGGVIDTGTNYDSELFYSSGTSTNATENLASTYAFAGVIPGTTAPANSAGHSSILIFNYANTTFSKNVSTINGVLWGTTTGLHQYEQVATVWRSSAAIDTIKLFPDSSTNFLVGTIIELVGIP
jgi:hypothetical protein